MWGKIWDFLKNYWFLARLTSSQCGVAANAGLMDVLRDQPSQETQLPDSVRDKSAKMQKAVESLRLLSE
jgi:hypothetical protein